MKKQLKIAKDFESEDYEILRVESFSHVLNLFKFAAENSLFYKELFSKNKINTKTIKTYEDFKKIPLSSQQDFRERNLDFLSLPKNELWQIFSTTGSTGEPKFQFYDKKRIRMLGPATELVLKRVGLNKKDLLAGVFFPLEGLSAGGPLAIRSCESLGIPVIGFGIMPSAELVAGVLKKMKPNFFYIYPSTFLKLIKDLSDMAFNPNLLDVKVIFSTGEPLTSQTRKIIQDYFKSAQIVDILASVDMSAYIASECKEHNGLHFLPSWVFFELIDLESSKLIEEGTGELVLSTLHSYGTPMFRYKTGDIVKITKERCKCGSNVPRVWILGRVDDRVILQGGKKFYVSSELNQFIKKFPEITSNYQLILDEEQGKDKISLRIESKVKNEELSKKISEELIKFSNPLSRAFAQNKFLKPVIELVDINSLERIRGKVKDKIIDNRKL